MNALAGVPACTAAASTYVWLQKKGPAACFLDNTTVIVGMGVTASTTVAGAFATIVLTPADTAGVGINKNNVPLGQVMSVSASAEYALVNLNIP